MAMPQSEFGVTTGSPPTRRDFLARAGSGCGLLALAGMLADEGALLAAGPSEDPMAPRPPHFPAKAKAVIWVFMNGGPSQVDTWDYKPELAEARRPGARRLRQEHRLLHRPGRPADEVSVPLQPPGRVGGLGLGDLPAAWAATSTTWPSSTPASPRRTTTPLRSSRSTPASAGWASPASARGSPTGWDRRARTCPGSS